MQWLSLPDEELQLHDDDEILRVPSWEECKRHCITWSEGPCKSFDFLATSLKPSHNRYSVCYLSHADQHSNPEDMKFSLWSHHVENCEGKKQKPYHNRLMRKITI